jgi:hypothetical protein
MNSQNDGFPKFSGENTFTNKLIPVFKILPEFFTSSKIPESVKSVFEIISEINQKFGKQNLASR